MSWSERQIASFLARYTLQKKCLVVVPNCNWTGHECDLLAVTQNLRVIDVEIKISRGDFRVDAAKDKWWRYLPWREQMDFPLNDPRRRQRITWPGRVWKHYYCLPASLWKPEMAAQAGSHASGILLIHDAPKRTWDRERVTEDFYIHCERPAKPNRDADKLSAEDAVDLARLQNLRMWDAYAEIDRLRRQEDRVAA